MNKTRGAILVLLLGFSCMSSFAADKQTSVAAVRAADQAWLKVFAAKNLEKSVAMCDDAGAILAPNAPASEGHTAISKSFAAFFALPNFKISWTPSKAEVSGDLGYTSGAYEFSFVDPTGKTIPDHGKYVTVWKKQKDGSWKVLLDIFNTDLPPAGM